MTGSDAAVVIAAFLATSVEMVEAATIVVAMGTSRSWRSAIVGGLGALAVLAMLIAALGPALVRIPIGTLRLVVGGLLLVFGLGWLREAILATAGILSPPDEDLPPTDLATENRTSQPTTGGTLDPYAVTVSFKGVLLEGLEVAFIVLSLGASQGRLGLAVLGALASLVVVGLAAAVVHAPLGRLPESVLSFLVGVLLVSFGTFWGAEGAGVFWPAGDASLLAVLGGVGLLATASVVGVRRFAAPRRRPA